jgi:putative AbiEii toxin of type IV toxin-antitoxin system
MYLTSLKLEKYKLISEAALSFQRDGQPRMWTVLLGENGLCKTAILQAIALAAIGPDAANKIADVSSYPDRRNKSATARIEAEFGFGDLKHSDTSEPRQYPGLSSRSATPPRLRSTIAMRPGWSFFEGESHYLQSSGRGERLPNGPTIDPLRVARGKGLASWFVAGYGTSRSLPLPKSIERYKDSVLERVSSLFGPRQIVGTGFADLLDEKLLKVFVKTLQHALLGQEQVLPRIKRVELRGKGGVKSAKHLVESHRFEFDTGPSALRVPATWLSQGYQAMISWIADLVGQILWEAKDEVDVSDMEGMVLIDEIDIHLHPTWQVGLVTALKRTFPRIQFVATTHSAMILPGLEPDEILEAQLNAEGDVCISTVDQSPNLLTGSEILGTFFGIDKLYPDPAGADLLRYGYLSTNPHRTDSEESEMRQILSRLRGAGAEPDWEPTPRRSGR